MVKPSTRPPRAAAVLVAASAAALAGLGVMAGCGGADEPTGDASVIQSYGSGGAPVLSVADAGGGHAVWLACTPSCREIGRGRTVRPDPAVVARYRVELNDEVSDAGHWTGPLAVLQRPDLRGRLAIGGTVAVDPKARWEGGWAGDRAEQRVEVCSRRVSSACNPLEPAGEVTVPDLSGIRWLRAVGLREPASAVYTAEAYPVGKAPTRSTSGSAAIGPFHRLER